jgi:hypothetical protein
LIVVYSDSGVVSDGVCFVSDFVVFDNNAPVVFDYGFC